MTRRSNSAGWWASPAQPLGAALVVAAAALLAPQPALAECTGIYYFWTSPPPPHQCGQDYAWTWSADCRTGASTELHQCGPINSPLLQNTCNAECTLQTHPPPRAPGKKNKCDPSLVGDPVMLGGESENTFHRTGDFSVATPAGPVDFYRTHNSASSRVIGDGSFSYGPVPKPFGPAVTKPTEVRWTHNFFSFIDLQQALANPSDAGVIHVVTPDSYVDTFRGPLNPDGGWLAPGVYNAGLEARLKYVVDASGGWKHFYYYREDGWVLQYDAPLTSGALPARQYLTRAVDAEGRERFSVAYATPPAGECPGVGAVEPYVGTVSLPAGPALRFHYLDAGAHCVLARVDAEAGASSTTLASYTYTTVLDGGVPVPRLTTANGEKVESYDHVVQSDGGRRFDVTADNAWLAVSHAADSVGAVRFVADSTGTFGIAVQPDAGALCQSACCLAQQGQQRVVTWTDAGAGDGVALASLTQRFSHLPASTAMLHTPAFVAREDSCSPSTACSAGTTVYDYRPVGGGASCAAGTAPQTLHATQDKRGAWTVTPTVAVDSGLPAQPFFERTASVTGAPSPDDAGLLSTALTYRYRADVHFPSTLADQRLEKESRPSVHGGGTADTVYAYDATTNRLKATFRTGKSRLINGDWDSSPRVIGTFYKTARTCENQASDGAKQRTLRVEGPCFVGDTAATGCPGTSFPVTEFYYHADSPASYSAGQLAEAWRYPNGCATGAALKRKFADYDAWGNARQVTDENDDVETLVYSGPRLLSRDAGTGAWAYDYEGEKLKRTTFPEGNVEVLCYRTGTSGDCTGGTLTDKLWWKAKAPSGWGANWSEKVAYSYWPDGTLKQEDFHFNATPGTGNGELRRSVFHASDAEKRPTHEKLGPQAGAGSALVMARAYDGADNVVALGQRYNAPLPFCKDAQGQRNRPTAGTLSAAPWRAGWGHALPDAH